jgi:hypothetical protein
MAGAFRVSSRTTSIKSIVFSARQAKHCITAPNYPAHMQRLATHGVKRLRRNVDDGQALRPRAPTRTRATKATTRRFIRSPQSETRPTNSHLRSFRGRRAAEERDEVASLHSITSSARARSVGGTSKPSCLAVLRLMRNSNVVGPSTGSSPGLVPLNILST